MVSAAIRKQQEEHIFLVTTIIIFFVALLNFIPFLVVFVKAHFLYAFYAVMLLLPLPPLVANGINQGNAASNVFSGVANNDILPTINFVIKCFDPIRQFWNAIVNTVRAMAHAVAVNFYPINRNTIFTIMKNVLFMITQFAAILITMLINLINAIVDLFTGKGFNFSFITAFMNFIIDTLVDVLDNPPCFHPLNKLPGVFIHCLDNDLTADDVNNAGFVGFLESIVIVICHNGTLQSDFINDILLPCTGLDAFFIFKQIYFWTAGNATNIFNDQVTRINNDVARIEHIGQEIIDLAPRIVSYIIRRICGGIAFFCKIIGSIGIAEAAKLSAAHLDDGTRSRTSGIQGVCVYHQSEGGQFLGCFYNDKSQNGFRNPDGTAYNFTDAYNTINQIQIGMNTTYPSFFKEFDNLQSIQNYLIYNTDLPNNHINNNINEILQTNETIAPNGTSSIILKNSFYGNAAPNSKKAQDARHEKLLKSNAVYQNAMFDRRKNVIERNYQQSIDIFSDHVGQMNETTSSFKTMLLVANHGIKALTVGLSAMKNHREIDSVYNYVRNGLDDIGFDFGEVMEALTNHTMTYHPGLHEETFTMSYTLTGVLSSLVFTGIASASSVFVIIIAALVGVIGFALTTLGSLGSLINITTGTQQHYDFGMNIMLNPLVDWTSTAFHQPMSSADTSLLVTNILDKIPVLIEVSVLQIVRLVSLCNVPVPLGPLSCPIEIPMNINDDTYVFDTTIDYLINITMMCIQDAACSENNPDTFQGGLCVNGQITCWGNIPYVQIPSFQSQITPPQKQCTFNGTRLDEHLPWYKYGPNWIASFFNFGFKFYLRIMVRGYSLPFILIPTCYIAGKICFCFKIVFEIIMYVAMLQYATLIFVHLPELCPYDNSACRWFQQYISFENGSPVDDDYYCSIVGIGSEYLGYLQMNFYIQVLVLLLATGIWVSIIYDILIVIKFIWSIIFYFVFKKKEEQPSMIKLKKN